MTASNKKALWISGAVVAAIVAWYLLRPKSAKAAVDDAEKLPVDTDTPGLDPDTTPVIDDLYVAPEPIVPLAQARPGVYVQMASGNYISHLKTKTGVSVADIDSAPENAWLLAQARPGTLEKTGSGIDLVPQYSRPHDGIRTGSYTGIFPVVYVPPIAEVVG